MIYSITGKLVCMEPGFAVVEAGGVGYRCSTTTGTLAKLPPRGQEVTLLTHLYLREDVLELFGFFTEEELRCFRLLIGVSGVGPKAALAILSALSPQKLMLAIAAGDAKAVKAPGVGPKLSQRIILELRDKFSAEDLAGGMASGGGGGGRPGIVGLRPDRGRRRHRQAGSRPGGGRADQGRFEAAFPGGVRDGNV